MSNTEVNDWQDEAKAPSASASPNDWQDEQPSRSVDNTGQQTNDVGNIVIVPKAGESFSDTMARAAAQGKKTTPEMINKEVATMPKKAGEVLAAAPAIGAAGVTAGAAGEALAPAAVAITKFVTAHPIAAGFAYHIAREMGVPLPKILDVLAKVKAE